MFLGTAPDPTFAVVHMPSSPGTGAVGVVMCPLFGWDDLCTHRARRAWAIALAEAGYPTIRLDLPGTGDSGGSPRSRDQISHWTNSLAAAASWLREDLSCSRVCCVGIGFGGMLAWLAAADGAAIDDFVLWAVPTRGRRLVREVHAAAMLSIDARVDLDVAGLPPTIEVADEDVLLDEAGQLTTQETLSTLTSINLAETPLPAAAERRVLLLQRDHIKADEDLAAHLRSIGAEVVTVADGNSYGPLMQYVQKSVVPEGPIASSIAWLSQAPTGAVPSASAEDPGPRIRGVDSVELSEDGIAIRESTVTFNLPSGRLSGILTEPVGVPAAHLTAVFFSGGSDRRIGPNRMWVHSARRWAAHGVASVRLDPPGIGDTDGDERAWDDTRRHYERGHTELALELLDALTARGLADRFVLVGFCSGAYRSVQVALEDPRVAGVFGIGMMIFRWTWWIHNVRDSWLTDWQPKPQDSRLKVWLAMALKRCLKVTKAAHHRYVRLAQFFPNRADRVLKRLSAQGTHVLLMFKPSSYAYEQLSAPRRHTRLRTLKGLEFSALPGDDQRFRPLLIQRVVQDAMDDALSTLLLDGPPAPGSEPDTDVTDIWARADEIGWTTVAGGAPAGDSVKGLSHSV